MRETSYDVAALQQFTEDNEPRLLPDQREAYSQVLHSVAYQSGSLFFLDAPRGTGKTFPTNLLLAKIRQKKSIAVAVASSGIAATMLTGGRTAHSTFKLPLNLTHTETATCNIKRGNCVGKDVATIYTYSVGRGNYVTQSCFGGSG